MFYISKTCSAFNEKTVGTKVIDKVSFIKELTKAIKLIDFNNQKTVGQAVVSMDSSCFSFVSSGVGFHTNNLDDYIIRKHRGYVGLYLKRIFAAPIENLDVVIYTKDAYINDPDIHEVDGELEEVLKVNPEYVIVAVLTNSTANKSYSYNRFVKNLAGANHNFAEHLLTVEGLIDKAKEVVRFSGRYATIAD